MFEMLIWNEAIVFTEIHIWNFYSTSQRDKQEETTHRPNDRKWLTDPDFLQKADNVRLSRIWIWSWFQTRTEENLWHCFSLIPTEGLPGSVATRRVIGRSVEQHLFLLFT